MYGWNIMLLSNMKIGRIDEFTTSNIGRQFRFPTNVVSDCCIFTAELRGHSEENYWNVK